MTLLPNGTTETPQGLGPFEDAARRRESDERLVHDMAATPFDIDRRTTGLETGQIDLYARVGRLETQADHVQIVAYLAAGAALLFGIINLALLLVLIGRLS